MDAEARPTRARPVARIGRRHGLAGAFRVRLLDPAAADDLAAADEVWIDGLGATAVTSFAAHGRDWLLRVERVRHADAAQRLVHATVHALPAGGADDDAAAPLRAVGLPVQVDGRPYGEVVAVDGPPAQPLLRVRGPGGDVLLPAYAPYVRIGADEVDVDDPPEGLLDAP